MTNTSGNDNKYKIDYCVVGILRCNKNLMEKQISMNIKSNDMFAYNFNIEHKLAILQLNDST